MKNFNKLASMTLALTLVFSGCTKDEVNPKNSHNQDYHQVQRSGYSDIELLGMAANIDEIQFRNGSYTVSFHGSATSYSVDIVSFDLDSIIEISISHGVVVSEALVDFDGETLDIGNDQYSFEDINLIQISS